MNSSRKRAGEAGRILKVNHAGEHGAVNIYAAQIALAKLRAPGLLPDLIDFKTHEERHRTIFSEELRRRGLRRCRSYHLCGVGGYVLGLITGLMGAQAIASATVAVERVVLRHLRQQLLDIGESDADAAAAISAILREEQYHHDQFASVMRTPNFVFRMLGVAISGATESVIWIGMRV